MAQHSPKSLLFVETGTNSGGSFGSLYEHLRAINLDQYAPHVIFFNHTRFVSLISDLGIPVHVVHDDLYSNTSRYQTRRRPQRLFEAHVRRNEEWYGPSDWWFHRRSVRELIRIGNEYDVSLIHTNDQPKRDLFAGFVAKSLGIPWISHIRSCACESLSPADAQFLNRRVDRFIAASADVKRRWIERGLAAEKMDVVYNGVPLPSEVAGHSHWNNVRLGRDEPIICCIGRLVELKGQKTLIEAFPTVLQSIPQAKLFLLGDGPQRDALNQRVAQLGLQNHIFFPGMVSDVPRWLKSVACNVLPSNSEVCSRAILECLAGGTPVIASDVGGNGELISHGQNGWLFPHGDSERLANLLVELLSGRIDASPVVREGQRIARDRFSIDVYCHRVSELYTTLLRSSVRT